MAPREQRGERQMSTTMGTAEGGEVAPGAPKPTHIDVHIHQEPVLNLSCLQWPSSRNTIPWTPGHKRLLVASWVVQVVLGLMSGVLGGLGCITFHENYPYSMARWVAGIWTGVVAMLAGVLCFIYEKWGGTCWALLRTLLTPAAFATASAAIYTGAYYFQELSDEFHQALCTSPPSWEPTRPPWEPTRPTSSPEEANRQHLCLSYLRQVKALSTGLRAMLLSIWVLLFLTSLTPMFLYCWRRRLQPKEEKDQKPLLGASKI
ncbi:transmembrane protein 176A isoform X1 [Myotis daubentonii]|uniref:transmembrane protein 176A isoform X1 n=2 Tax=Myotis daubentonii TaxID=98922 RepID=UPI0028733B79|nr:transmembrane protein 176A isoform X1 [Myotis daubentonii]